MNIKTKLNSEKLTSSENGNDPDCSDDKIAVPLVHEAGILEGFGDLEVAVERGESQCPHGGCEHHVVNKPSNLTRCRQIAG